MVREGVRAFSFPIDLNCLYLFLCRWLGGLWSSGQERCTGFLSFVRLRAGGIGIWSWWTRVFAVVLFITRAIAIEIYTLSLHDALPICTFRQKMNCTQCR